MQRCGFGTIAWVPIRDQLRYGGWRTAEAGHRQHGESDYFKADESPPQFALHADYGRGLVPRVCVCLRHCVYSYSISILETSIEPSLTRNDVWLLNIEASTVAALMNAILQY